MATTGSIGSERQYYIDWLRIILIFSVFLFHIGMIFNTWDWHVKNDVTYGGALKQMMTFLHYWRMPLLFLISGAGTWFALGKRSTGQYLGERAKRLFLPLLAGVFVLVPVQVFIEKSSQFHSLFAYYPHMFEGIYPEGNFSWHHLWFIAYLFFIALLISPFLGLLKSDRFTKFVSKSESFLCKPLALNIILIPLILSQILLRPYFPESTHDLLHDWAYMTYYIVFFLSGLILLPNKNIAEIIRKQRFYFLVEAVISTLVMFKVSYVLGSEQLGDIIWDLSSFFVAWSCGMAAVGFSKHYLNRDSKWRKLANEAIYPFYLLHQPVIVVLASIMTQWEISIGLKVLSIASSSFMLTIAIYWWIVRPVNALRIIFGMRVIRKTHVNSVAQEELRIQAVQMRRRA